MNSKLKLICSIFAVIIGMCIMYTPAMAYQTNNLTAENPSSEDSQSVPSNINYEDSSIAIESNSEPPVSSSVYEESSYPSEVSTIPIPSSSVPEPVSSAQPKPPSRPESSSAVTSSEAYSSHITADTESDYEISSTPSYYYSSNEYEESSYYSYDDSSYYYDDWNSYNQWGTTTSYYNSTYSVEEDSEDDVKSEWVNISFNTTDSEEIQALLNKDNSGGFNFIKENNNSFDSVWFFVGGIALIILGIGGIIFAIASFMSKKNRYEKYVEVSDTYDSGIPQGTKTIKSDAAKKYRDKKFDTADIDLSDYGG